MWSKNSYRSFRAKKYKIDNPGDPDWSLRWKRFFFFFVCLTVLPSRWDCPTRDHICGSMCDRTECAADREALVPYPFGFWGIILEHIHCTVLTEPWPYGEDLEKNKASHRWVLLRAFLVSVREIFYTLLYRHGQTDARLLEGCFFASPLKVGQDYVCVVCLRCE